MGSPDATTTIDGKQLPPPPPQFGGVIKETAEEFDALVAAPRRAAKGARHVLLIMTDDQGYGVSGTFGGVIPTPALDRVAKAGLRYTQFHSTALCSPTRAALITGRNHHEVGFGVIAELSTGYPGYDAYIGSESATIGRILRGNGYATSWFGKNHNTPSTQYAGPYDQWPSGMGFEYFYGFMGGESDQWTPYLFRDHTQIFPWVDKPGYNLITDMADEAITHMRKLSVTAPEQPFFVYYVPGGSHSPHQPTQEWIDKFKGKFDMGWNEMREQIFANQKRSASSPRHRAHGVAGHPGKWETLSADEKKLLARQAEVFAAYTAYTDHEIGRVIQEVEDQGKLDNTLIIYIAATTAPVPKARWSRRLNQFTAYLVSSTCRSKSSLHTTTSGARPPPTRTWPSPGRGRSTPRSSGRNRSPRTSAVRDRDWRSPGRPASRMPAVSAPSSTTSSTSCRRSLKSPVSRRRVGRWYRAKADRRRQHGLYFDKANADAPSTRKTQYFEMVVTAGSITMVGTRTPRRRSHPGC